MIKRTPLNSKTLKNRFPEIYSEFFSKCTVVCSSPRSITLLGEHAVRYGGITLRQSIPIRTYVGITPNKNSKIHIVWHKTFDPLLETFRDIETDEINKEKIEQQLLPFLEFHGVHCTSGFNIYILSELPFERAIGSAGAFFCPLIASFLLHTGKLTQEHINIWKTKTVADLIASPDTQFDSTFHIIWEWENIIYTAPSGANPFVALLPSTTPIIYSVSKSTNIKNGKEKKLADYHDL